MIGWEPFTGRTGFLAERHACGSSEQSDLAKEKSKKKRTAFGEEANQFRTKMRPFQMLSYWESADFLPGIAHLSVCLQYVLSPAGSQFCAVAHQLFEALL